MFSFFCSYCGAEATSDTPRWPTCKYCRHECKPCDRKDQRDARPHPMQPVEEDGNSVIRFKSNAIVRYLMEFARDRGTTLNELHTMDFNDEDWSQFSQLTGYSVSGFGELGFANKSLVETADEAAEVISNRMAEEKAIDMATPLGNVMWKSRNRSVIARPLAVCKRCENARTCQRGDFAPYDGEPLCVKCCLELQQQNVPQEPTS